MRFFSVVFSVCFLISTCFGQGDFMKRLSSSKNFFQTPLKIQKSGSARFQMVSHSNLELDLETLEYDTSYRESYTYNAQGNELVVEERSYYENGGDYLSKSSKSYDAKGDLVREDKWSYDFGLNRYVSEEYSLFENNTDGLVVRENKYDEGASDYYGYNLFEYDANGNKVKDSYFRVVNGVPEKEYYTIISRVNDGRPIELRKFTCAAGACELSQGTDYKYLPNGLKESETHFENINGVHEPYSTRLFEYGAEERVVKVTDLVYEQGVSVADEEIVISYNLSGIVDTITINAYEAINRIWKTNIEAVDFKIDKEIGREELVMPAYLTEDYFLYDVLYGKKLNEFRVIDYNEDGSVDYEELLVYHYSNFTSVSEQIVFDFTLSPNPASDVIKIGLSDNNTQRIEVYSINGTLMYSEDTNTSELSINIQDYERGTYLVKAIGVNGFRTKQFVKL
jgi:hypothetical protein